MFCEYIKRFLKIKLETSPHNYKDDLEYKQTDFERLDIELKKSSLIQVCGL